MIHTPLVSVIIPAYKPQFFEAALRSAINQTYAPMEIIICDDSLTVHIENIVRQYQADSTVAIHYQRNVPPLGELYNAVRTIEIANGHYVKFLHDDDVLSPECVARMVAVIEGNPQVALVSSRRQRIDAAGEALPDILQTSYPFTGDVLVNGRELVAFLGDHTLNFIGEPSCTLCRREDLRVFGEELMSINGCLIYWVGDLAMCAKLLQHGDLAMIAQPLVDFRVSPQQGSQDGRDSIGIGDKGHADFRRTVREMGWYQPGPEPHRVTIAPLSNPAAGEKVDLLALLLAAHKARQSAQLIEQWAAWRVPTPLQRDLIGHRLASAPHVPLIEILVLDLANDPAALKRTLASLDRARHFYPSLQALVLRELAHLNPMISQSTAQWILLTAAGDEVMPGGLAVAGLELLPDPDCRAVFCDEMLRQANGDLVAGLRPDFNLDYLLSFPVAMERHWLFRREVLMDAGGFDPSFGPALEFEVILRLINEGGMSGFGHIQEPLFLTPSPALCDSPAHRAAIEQHLRLRGYDGATLGSPSPGQYQIDYGHAWQPLVSIIVVLQNDLAAVQRCVMSVLEHTSYGHYELIVVDNGNVVAQTRQWLLGIAQVAPERIRVLSLSTAQSPAGARNAGAEQAKGEYLVWLDAHAAAVDGAWLAALLNHGLRQEVAIVGAKTVSSNGEVTHAGMILGLGGVAASAFSGARLDAPGYLNRLQVDQNYTAVAASCLLIRRSVFVEVGGFDVATFAAQGYDIDLCLRVGALGYLVVWTPRALLMHNPGPMPLNEASEQAAYERWLPVLAADPAYNLNFTLHDKTTSFDLVDSRISWRPLGWRPLPVVMAYAADTFGAGHYRIIQPFNGLRTSGQIEGVICSALMHPADLARYSPDAIVLQRPVSDSHLPLLRGMKAFSAAFKVYELDDYLPNLPLKSVHRGNFSNDILRTLRRGLGCVDRFVVSTQPLADAFKGLHPDIRVVPNRLDPAAWGQLPASRRRAGLKPRVGWAGGVGHEGDLALIFDLVKALAGEVEWVFLGGVPEPMRPYAASFHPGVEIGRYPHALAALDLDLALAPLEKNLFNECKSNLRLLEYGACGYPVVCSDIAPYGNLPVTRVRNRFKDWLDAIRSHLADLDASARMGDQLREVVRRDWMLDERGLADWRAAWLG